jgi:hypothetical protein
MLGSVNATRGHFQMAADDLAQAQLRWGGQIATLITHRFSPDQFGGLMDRHQSDARRSSSGGTSLLSWLIFYNSFFAAALPCPSPSTHQKFNPNPVPAPGSGSWTMTFHAATSTPTGMRIDAIVELRDDLGAMLQWIRSERHIRLRS